MSDARYTVEIKDMGGFSAHELYALLKLRVDVFVVEQNCAYPELDGKDDQALHLTLKRGEDIIAAARIFPPHDGKPAKIGRVAVSPAHRGERLGGALMEEALNACASRFPGAPVFLSAQSHLQRFYGSFGFKPVSKEYLEDGIPHVDMLKDG
ncbi:ElaA protein [Rhizobium aquaticum]|uniref:ElaA protein n=1 Tax=Rhizobium aquaticum TaxID=1549636 RepID=A0ABV2IVE9_9HYPH